MRFTLRPLARAVLVPTVLAAMAAVAPVVAVSDASAAPAQHARAAARPWTATVAISRAVIDSGQRVVITGKVTPAVRGTVVTVQKRLAGKGWVNEAKVKTSASGAYGYRDNPNTAGKRVYRVVVAATRAHAKGTSRTVPLTIFRWQDLTKVAVRSSTGTRTSTSIKINGVGYARGIAGYTSYYDDGFVDWNLDKRCTSLTARFGNGDESDDTATANVQFVVDGTPVYSDSFGLTESTAKVFDVTGAFRVAFKWTSSNLGESPDAQAGAEAVMAVPMVRCSF